MIFVSFVVRRKAEISANCFGRTLSALVVLPKESFAGGAFDWLTAYSLMTGAALLFGYGLLGATWLVMKTDGVTQQWARKCAAYVPGYVGFFL